MLSNSFIDYIAHYLLDLLATLALRALLALINAHLRLLDRVLQGSSLFLVLLDDSTLVAEHLSTLVLHPSRESLSQVPYV